MDNEASEKAYEVISGGDAHVVPLIFGCDVHEVASTIQIVDKTKKRKHQMDYIGDRRNATRNENGDHINRPSTTDHDEHNISNVKTFHTRKRSRRNESKNREFMKDTKDGRRKVSFSNEVEEFPLAQSSHKASSLDKSTQSIQHTSEEEKLIWGKRYTPEEDELIRKAVMDYIEANQLGDQGLHMVLHCQKYKKVRGCWNFISSALPWRPRSTTYLRAHSIFEKHAVSKWEPEQCELLKSCYAQHGPDWKKIAQIFGLSRHQVKDAFRRLKAENLIRGKWKQSEYQSLFDLVNMDLCMKAFQEKKSNHAVIRDDISWQAISVKLSTRPADHCCMKWYSRLASPMVKEGRWNDVDDYKMIDAIQKADPSCFEEVDWDNLLELRSGEICRKRWHEMIRHLDRFWAMTFVDQIDLLSQRYCPDMIPYREKNLSNHPDS